MLEPLHKVTVAYIKRYPDIIYVMSRTVRKLCSNETVFLEDKGFMQTTLPVKITNYTSIKKAALH